MLHDCINLASWPCWTASPCAWQQTMAWTRPFSTRCTPRRCQPSLNLAGWTAERSIACLQVPCRLERWSFHTITCAQAHKLVHFIQAMDCMDAAPCGAMQHNFAQQRRQLTSAWPSAGHLLPLAPGVHGPGRHAPRAGLHAVHEQQGAVQAGAPRCAAVTLLLR